MMYSNVIDSVCGVWKCSGRAHPARKSGQSRGAAVVGATALSLSRSSDHSTGHGEGDAEAIRRWVIYRAVRRRSAVPVTLRRTETEKRRPWPGRRGIG